MKMEEGGVKHGRVKAIIRVKGGYGVQMTPSTSVGAYAYMMHKGSIRCKYGVKVIYLHHVRDVQAYFIVPPDC